jgi:hypothetical protein
MQQIARSDTSLDCQKAIHDPLLETITCLVHTILSSLNILWSLSLVVRSNACRESPSVSEREFLPSKTEHNSSHLYPIPEPY